MVPMREMILSKTSRQGPEIELEDLDRERFDDGQWRWTLSVRVDGRSIGRGPVLALPEGSTLPSLRQLVDEGVSHVVATRPVIGLFPHEAQVLGSALDAADSLRPPHWWRERAAQGDPESQFRWAGLLREGGEGLVSDADAAHLWLQRAAASGHPLAQVNLALTLVDDGDDDAARHWLVRAARQGEPTALAMLEIDSPSEIEDEDEL